VSADLVTIDDTGGLGPVVVAIPDGRQTITPASRMAVAAIGHNASLLAGRGIDWGSGTGLLAVGAARIDAVTHVLGLELDAGDVPVATANARRNGVAGKSEFIHSDSYRAVDPADQPSIEAMRGGTDFLIGNPPASRTGDGLDWRREALRGGLVFLRPGAPVLLQISYQYAINRIEGLVGDVPGYRYEGVAGSTDWVPFDQSRPDLSTQLVEYARFESGGGIPYTFGDGAGGHLTATEALERRRATGESPLSKWQMHLFTRVGR
jgi:hypothetical protein